MSNTTNNEFQQQMFDMMKQMQETMASIQTENLELKKKLAEVEEEGGKKKKKTKKKSSESKKTVVPIKDNITFKSLLDNLKSRDKLMCLIGIAGSLRISDILPLQLKHIKTNGSRMEIKEKKTSKWKVVELAEWKEDIELLLEELNITESNQYLFASQKKDKDGNEKPISRQQAWEVLKNVSFLIGVRKRDSEGNLVGMRIGTHSLRKTFAYWFYISNPNSLAYLMKILNHSRPDITLRYIGIEQDELSEKSTIALKALKLR